MTSAICWLGGGVRNGLAISAVLFGKWIIRDETMYIFRSSEAPSDYCLFSLQQSSACCVSYQLKRAFFHSTRSYLDSAPPNGNYPQPLFNEIVNSWFMELVYLQWLNYSLLCPNILSFILCYFVRWVKIPDSARDWWIYNLYFVSPQFVRDVGGHCSVFVFFQLLVKQNVQGYFRRISHGRRDSDWVGALVWLAQIKISIRLIIRSAFWSALCDGRLVAEQTRSCFSAEIDSTTTLQTRRTAYDSSWVRMVWWIVTRSSV